MRFLARQFFLKQVLSARPVVRDAKCEGTFWEQPKTSPQVGLRSFWNTFEVEVKGVNGGPTRKMVAASTPDPDRYDDIVDQDSINFRHWKAALAPLLYAHDSGYWNGGAVIGRAEPDSIQVLTVKRPDLTNPKPEQLKAFCFTPEWDDHQSNPIGQRVAHQWSKFINTLSIGFVPHKVTLRRLLPKEHWAYGEGQGLFFQDCEIYETSAVPIPANPFAMEMDEEGIPARQAPPSAQAPSQKSAQWWGGRDT